MIKIEREALDLYGGAERFDADVFTFQQALKDHAKTVGQPAPVAHPFVERVVRESGGKYSVIEPVPVIAPVEPEKSLDELQTEALNRLSELRRAAANQGVTMNGVRFSSKGESLTALLAAKIEAELTPGWQERWRVGPGNYVLIRAPQVEFLIEAIRALHRKAFDRERELSEQIVSAITPKALAKIDLTKGWEF